MNAEWKLRLALEADVPSLNALIPRSVYALQADCYSRAQMDAALGPIFGVDRQLISDGTYFVAENAGQIIAAGGWSRRLAKFGGDSHRSEENVLLDPRRDSARIRAFFVAPEWARRGIGRTIVLACEEAIKSAGFHSIELVATLAGEPLYLACGYVVADRYRIPMRNELTLPVLRMTKRLG